MMQLPQKLELILTNCQFTLQPVTIRFIWFPVVKNVAKNSIDNAHHIQMIDTAPNDNFQFLKKKGLHFIHVNVRSLIPKLDEIKLLLLKRNITVLALSETWLNDSVSDSEIDIHGYVVVRKDRNRHGGGVCLYVNCNIAFNPRIDLKRTLSPYFRNLPLLHITIRLHLTSRLLKLMQWLARKQYVLVVGNAIWRNKWSNMGEVGDNTIDL